MRLIDADALEKRIPDSCFVAMCGEFRNLVRSMPTIASPPNPPLTLEELREMDGEPVYMTDLTGGTLWNQWIIFQKSTDDGFIPRGGGWFSAENYGKTWLSYRRKPEEGTI